MSSSVAGKSSPRPDVPTTWLLMSYQVPRSPAAPYMRIYRRLKTLKVLLVRPGLAALPEGAIAEGVLQSVAAHINSIWGGSATLLRSDVLNDVDHLVVAYNDERNAEYEEIISTCARLSRSRSRRAPADDLALRRHVARMTEELDAVTVRDAFGASHRALAVEAIRNLGFAHARNGAR